MFNFFTATSTVPSRLALYTFKQAASCALPCTEQGSSVHLCMVTAGQACTDKSGEAHSAKGPSAQPPRLPIWLCKDCDARRRNGPVCLVEAGSGRLPALKRTGGVSNCQLQPFVASCLAALQDSNTLACAHIGMLAAASSPLIL